MNVVRKSDKVIVVKKQANKMKEHGGVCGAKDLDKEKFCHYFCDQNAESGVNSE